jgi:spermidine/putrescine transport system substrate-binding protein
MTLHPRERRGLGGAYTSRMPRRRFIHLSALGAGLAGFAPALLAAQRAAASGDDQGGVKLSRPDDPATLPTFDDVQAIEDGLAIETGTLKVYNYEEYISPDVLAAFEDEFGVTVEVTTFTSMDEAVARLASGQVDFDVFFPTPDRIGQLAAAKLMQPLNKSYLPNLANVWPALQDPFYDLGSVYTVPYTLYTTGIGYRIDGVATAPDGYDNPYDIFWDEANAGQVFVLEDDREVFGMALLHRDPAADVNTEDPEAIEAALADVSDLVGLVNIKVGAEAYTVLPENRAWVHQCWSGDVVNAQYYLPEGESIDDVGYWYPPEGGGIVGSDSICVLRSATKPVLAHTFLDYLLDEGHALENYGWLGYQPPQNALDPDTLVADGYVPEHLAPAIVRPEDFDSGQQLLQLSLEGERLWDNAWSRFSAGG